MAKLGRAIISHPDEDEQIELLGDLAEQYLRDKVAFRYADLNKAPKAKPSTNKSDGKQPIPFRIEAGK